MLKKQTIYDTNTQNLGFLWIPSYMRPVEKKINDDGGSLFMRKIIVMEIFKKKGSSKLVFAELPIGLEICYR